MSKGKSTKMALVHFVSACIDAMEEGETVVGCFADLTKAFDSVEQYYLYKIKKSMVLVALF